MTPGECRTHGSKRRMELARRAVARARPGSNCCLHSRMLTAHRPRLRCSRLFAAPAVYSSRRWHDREHFLANRELRGGLASARRQTAAMQGHRKAWWNGKRQGRARGGRSRTRLRPARRLRGARQRVAGIKACAYLGDSSPPWPCSHGCGRVWLGSRGRILSSRRRAS